MSAGGRSRTAALALLVGVFVVLGAAIFVPIALYWAKSGATISDARAKIEQAEEQRSASAALEEARTRWTAFAATPDARFVLAATDEAGVDALRSIVGTLFSEVGGEAGEIAVEATDGPREGVRRLDIEARGILPKSALGPFLTRLESGAVAVILRTFEADRIDRNRVRIRFGGSAYRIGGPTE